MAEPSTGEYPWVVLHEGHPAWYQWCLMVGDFAPGKKPLPNYVLRLDGVRPSAHENLKCGTCGKPVKTEDLDVMERSTKKMGWFDNYRRGKKDWQQASITIPDTCYHCNYPIDGLDEQSPQEVRDSELSISLSSLCEATAHETAGKSDRVKVCSRCARWAARRCVKNRAKLAKAKALKEKEKVAHGLD